MRWGIKMQSLELLTKGKRMFLGFTYVFLWWFNHFCVLWEKFTWGWSCSVTLVGHRQLVKRKYISGLAMETKLAFKPWKAEYAKSARSSCRTCGHHIEKDSFRLARMQPAQQFGGMMPVSVFTWTRAPDELYSPITTFICSLNGLEELNFVAQCHAPLVRV